MIDAMGDRLKELEGAESDRRCMAQLPIIARLDGKGFSRFTRDMKRPYDTDMAACMQATTAYLVEETNAACGYTQSDEITLAWYTPSYSSERYFGGRIQKMVSILAAKCSVRFNKCIREVFGEHGVNKSDKEEPVFDCRVFAVPTLSEGANCFLWREFDATKNSISMAAQSYYSHKELMNKNGKEKQEMLFQKGINWNDYPVFFKRGSYFQRRAELRPFTAAEISELPAKHAARTNPHLTVERHKVKQLQLPPLNTVVNRVDVIFNGADPLTGEALIQYGEVGVYTEGDTNGGG